MKRLIASLLIGSMSMLLTSCTASQAATVATAAISAEIAASIAAGCGSCVIYGDALLSGVACVTEEYASADTAAIKVVKYGACASAALTNVPGTNPVVIAVMNAAFDAFLESYGIAPPPAFAAIRASHPPHNLHVVTHDGRPRLIDRHEALVAADKALKARRVQ